MCSMCIAVYTMPKWLGEGAILLYTGSLFLFSMLIYTAVFVEPISMPSLLFYVPFLNCLHFMSNCKPCMSVYVDFKFVPTGLNKLSVYFQCYWNPLTNITYNGYRSVCASVCVCVCGCVCVCVCLCLHSPVLRVSGGWVVKALVSWPWGC